MRTVGVRGVSPGPIGVFSPIDPEGGRPEPHAAGTRTKTKVYLSLTKIRSLINTQDEIAWE